MEIKKAFFNSALHRKNWGFVYGASHYLYNKINFNDRIPTTELLTFTIGESLASFIIENHFLIKIPVNYETSTSWKHPSKPIPKNILESAHVHYVVSQTPELLKVLNDVKLSAEKYYRVFMRLAKVRLIKLTTGFKGEWHRDDFPTGIHKVLVYLSGAGRTIGTTEIITTNGKLQFPEGPRGVAALFDTNSLLHRAIGSEENGSDRYSLEATFVPTIDDKPIKCLPEESPLIAAWPACGDDELARAESVYEKVIGVGGGARHYDEAFVTEIYKRNYERRPKFLNIGGGASFLEVGWKNLDGAFGKLNPTPTDFSPRMVIGEPAESLDFIYSSHTFEHLDLNTVQTILRECSRVLKPHGYLMIKVPDVERYILQINDGFLEPGAHRCLCGVHQTWPAKGVRFTGWQIISFLACSAWNNFYADDIFNDQQLLKAPGAYFGPAPNVKDDQLEEILRTLSPKESAQFLRRSFNRYQNESGEKWKWGHQSAWSLDDLVNDVEPNGFKLVSGKRDEILEKIKPHPKFFLTQFDISIWALFEKL
jgi:SAM-dependent methyltransferase